MTEMVASRQGIERLRDKGWEGISFTVRALVLPESGTGPVLIKHRYTKLKWSVSKKEAKHRLSSTLTSWWIKSL